MRFQSGKFSWRLVIMLVVCTAFSLTTVAQQGTELRPGIVVDPSTNTVYAMTPEGIAAVDLTSGAKKWTTNVAAKPLAFSGGLLISQVEPKTRTSTLELATLDTKERGAITARSTAPLPSMVRVAIGQTLEGTFETEARMLANTALVTWRFERLPLQGTRDAPEGDERRIRKEPTPAAAPAANQAKTATRLQTLSEGALRVNLATGAVSTDDVNVNFSAAREWLVTGEKVSGAPPTQYASADNRHIMASERIADDNTWAKYRWTVFEKASNKRVGAFLTHLSFAPFVVKDSTLIYETTPYIRAGRAEPAKLRGISLANGQEIWSIEVRELEYRGPFPP